MTPRAFVVSGSLLFYSQSDNVFPAENRHHKAPSGRELSLRLGGAKVAATEGECVNGKISKTYAPQAPSTTRRSTVWKSGGPPPSRREAWRRHRFQREHKRKLGLILQATKHQWFTTFSSSNKLSLNVLFSSYS